MRSYSTSEIVNSGLRPSGSAGSTSRQFMISSLKSSSSSRFSDKVSVSLSSVLSSVLSSELEYLQGSKQPTCARRSLSKRRSRSLICILILRCRPKWETLVRAFVVYIPLLRPSSCISDFIPRPFLGTDPPGSVASAELAPSSSPSTRDLLLLPSPATGASGGGGSFIVEALAAPTVDSGSPVALTSRLLVRALAVVSFASFAAANDTPSMASVRTSVKHTSAMMITLRLCIFFRSWLSSACCLRTFSTIL
mmetsp:Transcript_44572/g.82672  ORF Transcript_44572/g.82672 Transcript_44572/m.82672 type:complete len:251 (+) Transcript_44572:697-1449(+)